MTENIFENVGRLFFTRENIKDISRRLRAAGIDMPADALAGYLAMNVFVVALVLSIAFVLYPPTSDFFSDVFAKFLKIDVNLFVLWLLSFLVLLVFVYLSARVLFITYLLLKIEDRRNKIESVLPDFLMLVSSNIKAGMTLDQAMWYSAKPEFGLLSEEVRSAVKSSFSGESLDKALDRLASRFDSRPFRRAMILLKQASETGGELTGVLESAAEDVRNTLIMRKEISASLVLYEIFILFVAIFGTPFLFGVSKKLIEVFEKLSPYMPSTSMSNMSYFGGLSFVGPQISSTDFFYFSIGTIFITSLISSFIIGTIKTGSKNQGWKYFPFILTFSYIVFWLVNVLLDSFFASFR